MHVMLGCRQRGSLSAVGKLDAAMVCRLPPGGRTWDLTLHCLGCLTCFSMKRQHAVQCNVSFPPDWHITSCRGYLPCLPDQPACAKPAVLAASGSRCSRQPSVCNCDCRRVMDCGRLLSSGSLPSWHRRCPGEAESRPPSCRNTMLLLLHPLARLARGAISGQAQYCAPKGMQQQPQAGRHEHCCPPCRTASTWS